jgi:hypothetical protein
MTQKIEYTVININEFLKIKPSGEFDREETLNILKNLSELIASSDDSKILLDIREAFPSIPLTIFDVYEFVDELVRSRTTFHNKIAILTREDFQFDNAKFFEMCAKNRGFKVKAFTDFEAAIEWFSQAKTYEKQGV